MNSSATGPLKGRWQVRLNAAASAAQRLGITPRMVISFAAVALLAGTANMIARESVHIIRTVTHTQKSQTISRPGTLSPPANIAADPILLRSAIQRFEQAVRRRVDGAAAADVSNYAEAKRGLQLAAERGTEEPQRIAAYVDSAKQLIISADERRRARSDFGMHMQSATDRIAQSLERAWTLFGRVIARKSLLQLRNELDAIRAGSQPLLSGESPGRQESALLTAAQAALAQSLNDYRVSLRKSEGDAWFDALSADFAALVKSREILQSSNARFTPAQRTFQDLGDGLEKVLIQGGAAKRVPSAMTFPVSPIPEDAVVETAIERDDPSAARIMALVTALVMLVIIAISVFTVRSIVLPVRRLVQAARQLADGRTSVRVGRGGIKELDLVAQAFDEMSGQLETVRSEYRKQQETLEHQVVERTYRLQRLAYQDPLTSLPNRRHLFSLLGSALGRAGDSGRQVGVFFLDIDNFKNINDSLGHVFGDRVLMSVANRLEEVADGVGFVARWGGDEFTLVFESADSADELHAFGQALTVAFDKLISVDDREISISVSVGASRFPEHESEPEALLRAADSALFRAKELGRNQLAVFTPELIASAENRFTVQQGLRLALKRGELELAYQPEIHLVGGEMDSVEALLRWRQPGGKLARPGEFLAIAEQSGLMPEINAWVLETAFRDASCWHHGGWADTRVAINISARQLVDRLFVDSILRLLDKWRLPAKCIELELTESVLQTGPSTITALRVLRSHGFGIALDDFGTGYSSLTSLEQLPLSRVKLDAKLVAGIGSSPRASAIARAIIDLCAGLGLDVTAEGIERPEQFAWFAQRSDISLQGFLFSEALDFCRVLPFRSLLAGKLNDLHLSLPSATRSTPPVPQASFSRTTAQSNR
jgi:diguanylate cyclase (GGDEF)-like protein